MERTVALIDNTEAFSIMISRSFQPVKPHPAAIHHICGFWGVDASDVIMCGDSIDDIACGKAAGATTVLIGEDGEPHYDDAKPHAHFTIASLAELPPLVDRLNGGAGRDSGSASSSASVSGGTPSSTSAAAALAECASSPSPSSATSATGTGSGSPDGGSS